ncbi:putative RND superfamily exporter [Cylindrospermum stagnale PCC 7417]|uniref:Putative RND superfamily exporter n=1 Tax=Cylindrospermum stagnale PCC 7417 TaxID=56107 RepID=K9X4W7_9NOST|nr:patatin-like phospholipase family protein [Cylindrospermum stagnale]AFZ26702.1 putative RND superfamily exporter [Cylindrospermum stagnale PCC 7417]
MNINKQIQSIVACFLLAGFGLWLTNNSEMLRYFFFLRVPILVCLLLVFFPLISVYLFPSLLKNLFVLRSNGQLILVIIGATLAGISTVLVYNIILTNAYLRFALNPGKPIPESMQDIIAILLAYPIVITSIYLSRKEIRSQKTPIWKGIISGVGLAMILIVILDFVKYILKNNDFLKQIILNCLSLLPKELQKGYILRSGELAPGIIEAIAFLLVLLVLYFYGYVKLQPQAKCNRFEAPALVYVTLILSIMVLLLGGMSFFLDYPRVPVLLLFIVISAAGYLIFQVDHFYNLKDSPVSKPQPDDWKQAINKRLEYQGNNKILVVICASGGGIQAAGWTTAVLTGLQELIGISFTQAIGWVSSVSGGSVGAMYYLDRFGDNGYPEQEELQNIFDSATKDSLDAIGWGLAYPDLLRFIGFPFLVPKMEDRGTAIEIDWRGELKHPKTPPSLTYWREKVEAGIIPIPIFNATLVEDGRRFLISPMTFYNPVNDQDNVRYQDFEYKYIDFNTLYPKYDIDITTAARLSATFPYLSPVSRPNKDTGSNFHVADGGYFDNFGVATSVQLLDKLLGSSQQHQIKKVLFLQINAFADSPINNQNQGKPGWQMEVFGSIEALLKVRSSTQTAGNLLNVKFLREKWKKQNVEIADFTITFPRKINTQPLSWQLTQEQKEAIKKGWKELKDYQDDELVIQQIEQKWQQWHRQSPPNLE